MAALAPNARPKHNADSSQDIRHIPTHPIQISQRNALLRIPHTGEFLVLHQDTRSEVRVLFHVFDLIQGAFRTAWAGKFDRL